MSTTVKIFTDLTSKCIDSILYRSMIGSLVYITASSPDIAFSVSVCVRFQDNPKESHLIAVQRIIKYLRATVYYGIWYSKYTNLKLVGYSNTNWVGSADNRRSTLGGCFYIRGNLIAWMSKN